MKTLCNDCIFFKDIETCDLGRLKIFEKTEEDNKVIVNRFCNTKRTEKWKKNNIDYVNAVLDEIYVKLDVIVLDNHKEIYESLKDKRINHIYLINSKEEFKLNKNTTSIKILFGDFIKTIIPKLSGEYVLILNNEFDLDLEKLNNRLNINLEKIPYIKDPILVNKALLTIIERSCESFNEILEKLNSLEEKNIKQW